MFHRTAAALFALTLATGVTTGAEAQVPLSEQSEITEGLITAAIAYEIGRRCDTLDTRLLRGLTYLNGLRSRAGALGYSRAEVDAYIDDAEEKARLEEIARARLTTMGAVEGDRDSYCSVGREEISRGTRIGRLLRG